MAAQAEKFHYRRNQGRELANTKSAPMIKPVKQGYQGLKIKAMIWFVGQTGNKQSQAR